MRDRGRVRLSAPVLGVLMRMGDFGCPVTPSQAKYGIPHASARTLHALVRLGWATDQDVWVDGNMEVLAIALTLAGWNAYHAEVRRRRRADAERVAAGVATVAADRGKLLRYCYAHDYGDPYDGPADCPDCVFENDPDPIALQREVERLTAERDRACAARGACAAEAREREVAADRSAGNSR